MALRALLVPVGGCQELEGLRLRVDGATVTEVRYCSVGHTRPTDDGTRIRVTADPPAWVCERCETDMRQWLRDIPERYCLLPVFINHGTAERNPDAKAVKRTEAPAPMRLEIVDLLDQRRARRWLGTSVTEDRRGVLGTLESWARLVREERHSPPPKTPTTVTGEAHTLARHLGWCCQQPWVDEMHAELKALNRDLSDAVGDHRQRPVGRCAVDDEHGVPCGGPLMPTKMGGVRCVRCGDDWDRDELARLGLLLHETQRQGA